jgi:hypothetical protein
VPTVPVAIKLVLQLSVTVAAPKAALISAGVGLQGTVVAAARVITGFSVSRLNVSVCVTGVAAFPHESVAFQVRVMVLVQPVPCSAPSVNVAVNPVVQLSVTEAVPNAASMAEAVGLHPTPAGAVTVITGGWLSAMVTGKLQVSLLHPFNEVTSFNVYVPHEVPATTVTVCPVEEPEMVPLPVMIH